MTFPTKRAVTSRKSSSKTKSPTPKNDTKASSEKGGSSGKETVSSVWHDRAAQLLVQDGLCDSYDEAFDTIRCMMSVVVAVDFPEPGNNGSNSSSNRHTKDNDASTAQLWHDKETFIDAGLSCFDVPEEQLAAMFDAIRDNTAGDNDKEDDLLLGEQDETVVVVVADKDYDTTNDEEDETMMMMIGEGDCELCERHVHLTCHHLIPRSTWPRLEPRLAQALEAWQEGDTSRAYTLCGDGLQHLLMSTTLFDNRAAQRQWVRLQWLGRVCLVCRACHAAIHRTHPNNMTLAWHYNTVDKLLADPAIYKFAKWASRQKKEKQRPKELLARK